MELRHYINIVWKWAWLLVLSVAIAAGSSYYASKAATPLYRTKTTMMIGSVIDDPNPNTSQIYTSQQLAYTYIQLARREPVLKGAIDSLGLQMNWGALAGQVSASSVPQTQLLEITVVDSDPYRAKVLADAIAQQLILQSPAGNQETSQDQQIFAQAQLDDLKLKIENAQTELTQLNQELDAANSARQIQDLQSQISLLENKVSSWQLTYSQLLTSLKGGTSNVVSVVEKASVPGTPFSPNTRMNVLVAAAIGAVLAIGGAFLIEYLDDTVKSPDDVTRFTGLPVLGAIARIEGDNYDEKLIAANQPLSPIVESYRILRTNLRFSFVDTPARTLLMSSPSPSEGKSVTLANLAVVLAQSGLRVILVDTDLRRPVQHKIFRLLNRYGMTDAILQISSVARNVVGANPALAQAAEVIDDDAARVAALVEELQAEAKTLRTSAERFPSIHSQHQAGENSGSSPIERFLQDTPIENLRVMTSGSLPPNPAELLGSERMIALIEALKEQADLVLFDSPPTLVVADAAILSARVDGVIMVNDSGRTRSAETRRAVDELRRVHANMLGVVLNRLSRRSGGYNYYYYYYYYYSEDGDKRRKKKSHGWLSQTIPWLSRGNHRSNHKPKA